MRIYPEKNLSGCAGNKTEAGKTQEQTSLILSKENMDFHDRYYCTIYPEIIAHCNHSVTTFNQLVAGRK